VMGSAHGPNKSSESPSEHPFPALEASISECGSTLTHITTVLDEVPCIHQSQLLSLPKTTKQLNTHIFGSQFRRAQETEWQDLRAKGVFRRTEQSKTTANSEVLPLMWVFTYKTDGDGYLSRFKAQPVVRGTSKLRLTIRTLLHSRFATFAP
jgi:hypothetical protein